MKYRVRISKGNPINVAITKPVISTALIKKKGTKTNAVRTTIAAIIALSCNGNILVKTLPEEVVNILSLVYVTLLNIVNSFRVKINDIGNKNKLYVVYSITTFAKQIPTQNITFQKLSLFKRSLIQFIQLTTNNSYRYIVPFKGVRLNINRKLLVVITTILFTSVANAGDLESLIGNAEKQYGIPKDLLLSIALVESRVNPYALNVEGKAVLAKSAGEVKSKLRSYLKSGFSSIDIGVMQINYRWHRQKFSSLDEMLEPSKNIEYAAKYLKELYEVHGSWIKAVRHYHSASPKYHKKYSRKIIVTWLNR